jgi:DNA mismatch endonuclease (patch repair protein)
MASVGQKDTRAELILRSALHKVGFRYKLHERSLPGTPDLVFPRFHAAVFVHGCYWHAHGCYRATIPKSQPDFWNKKFQTNRLRDERNLRLLLDGGWRVLTVWECCLLGKNALQVHEVTTRVHAWLHGTRPQGEIAGNPRP